MNLENMERHKVKVILQFAIPSIIAMVLSSMINIVDGYFIGNYVGTEGLAAVNLGLPIVYLYLAVGLMIAVGGISIAGRLLGAKKIEDSNQVFRQTMVMCVVVSIAITIVMFFVLEPISNLFHADGITREYFVTYYRVLIFELPIMVIISGLGMFIRGEGNPMFVMVTNLMSVVLNIVLDYIFVKPLAMGVKGVALASLISVLIILAITVLYMNTKSKIFRFGRYKFNKDVFREIIFNGSSEFIGELSMCISMAAYNYVVLRCAGVEGVAAFTIIGYVSYVFSMIIIGFGQGIVPLVSFSYGAKKHPLDSQLRNTTIKMVTGVAIGVFVLMSLLTKWYCRLFSDSSTVAALVTPGLRLQMSSFAFAGINTITSFYFTAIGKAKESAVISGARGLVILMIAIAILPNLFGITGVWLVSLTTELLTFFISIWYMKKNRIPLQSRATCKDGNEIGEI